jgi:hypothetical protein
MLFTQESSQTMGRLNIFFAWIIVSPHVTTNFTIIVVDMPPTYGIVLGKYWYSLIEGYIMNDGSCMMFPHNDGKMVRVPREFRKHVSFRKKVSELMQNYLDVEMGNYVVLDPKQLGITKQEK